MICFVGVDLHVARQSSGPRTVGAIWRILCHLCRRPSSSSNNGGHDNVVRPVLLAGGASGSPSGSSGVARSPGNTTSPPNWRPTCPCPPQEMRRWRDCSLVEGKIPIGAAYSSPCVFVVLIARFQHSWCCSHLHGWRHQAILQTAGFSCAPWQK